MVGTAGAIKTCQAEWDFCTTSYGKSSCKACGSRKSAGNQLKPHINLRANVQMGKGKYHRHTFSPTCHHEGLKARFSHNQTVPGLYSRKVINSGWWYNDRIMGVRPAIGIHETYRTTIVLNSSVNLWHTCSGRTANRKSTLPRYHWNNFANYCQFIEVLPSINVKAFCLFVSSLTSLQMPS